MTIEEGARLRARAVGKNPCSHALVALETTAGGEPTGSHVCTECGQLLRISSSIGPAQPVAQPVLTRRRAVRVRLVIPVRFWVDGDGHGCDGETLNVSELGCAIRSDRVPAVHSYGQCLLRLEDHDMLWIESAAVRWSKAQTYGVEFILLGDADRGRLRRYLAAVASGATSEGREAAGTGWERTAERPS